MTKSCLNPECRKAYTPGHYGRRQRVCGAVACAAWYRAHWRATRRPPRGLPAAVYAKVVAALQGDPGYLALITCARETGLRKGELLGLRWGDLLDGAGQPRATVEITGQWQDGKGFVPTKTHASRLGLFSTTARKALALWRRTCAARNGRGAAQARVWPVSESWAWVRWVALQTSLGIANPDTGAPYRFHDLRHMVGIELVRAGRIDLAKKMLGHKRLDTTLIYSEQDPVDTLADVEKIRRKGGAI